MAILYVDIDLAMSVFTVQEVNELGSADLTWPSVARPKLLEHIAGLPSCTTDEEACSGAHYLTGPPAARGLTVHLMAPKSVAPYRLSAEP